MKPPNSLQQSPPPGYPISNDPAVAAARFDASSMAVIALVFVSALIFLGFCSIIARRFLAAEHHSTLSSYRHGAHPPAPLGLAQHNRLPRPACLGLDAATLKSLPVLTFTSGGSETAWCVVCLGEFEEKEKVKLIPGCGHVFHPVCIDAWLGSHGSCPLCRSEMVKEKEICLDLRAEGVEEEEEEEEEETEDEEEERGRGEERMAGLGRSSSGKWGRIERAVFLRRSSSF